MYSNFPYRPVEVATGVVDGAEQSEMDTFFALQEEISKDADWGREGDTAFEATLLRCVYKCDGYEGPCDAVEFNFETSTCKLYALTAWADNFKVVNSVLKAASGDNEASEQRFMWLRAADRHYVTGKLPSLARGHRRTPSPFFNPFSSLDPERLYYWSAYADWSFYPYLLQFSSIQDIFVQLGTVDFQRVAAKMKAFNEKAIVLSATRWRAVLGGGA